MSGLKTVGPTMRLDFERVSPDLVAAAAKFGTATLHEAAGKIGALPSALKPVAPSFRICGPAYTVHGPAIDNLWLHRAIATAQPGDVLVAYVNGVYEAGYWGEIMSTGAKARGLGGLVIDGCVRDGDLLEGIGFPIFARGLCMGGTGKDFGARGWLNAPIMIGDVTVQPGDLVAGDTEGVVVVPRAVVADTVEASASREAMEAKIMDQLREGASTLDLYGWNK
jgi:4-hydroxy-4-methyl-2-oxoglutarate aldolase